MLRRRAPAVLAALAAIGCATACDSDESSSSATATIVIETTDPRANKVQLQAPPTVPAGPVEIELRNRGDTPHDAQLLRVDGRHAPSEVAAFLEDFDGTPRPRWLHAAGGVAPVGPGGSATVRQVLEPGIYIVADTQEREDRLWMTNAAKGGTATFEATGDGGGGLPATPARITARDGGFDVAGIRPGRNRVTFRNAGREPHQAVALRLRDAGPVALAKRIAVERIGDMTWVPVDVPGNRATTVLDPGDEQIATLDFEPGRYVVLCLVPPRSGGEAQWKTGTATNLSVGAKTAGRGR
jgi:hypothetical protein